MDKRISPQDLAVLDRRQLLRGAAAATAIRALPASERAVAAPQEIEAANLAGWSHFSADTLRRLEKILGEGVSRAWRLMAVDMRR